MSEDILAMLSYITFCISFLFLCASVFVFFKFRILEIWDELSGRKEQREISEYRKQRTYQKKRSNILSRKDERVTERIAVTKTGEITSKLATGTTIRDSNSEETSLLGGQSSDETELLTESGTEVLQEGGTELLQESGTTTLLEPNGTTLLENNVLIKTDGYCLILNEVVIHTMEYI